MDERDKTYREKAGEHFAGSPRDPWPDDDFAAPVIDGKLPDFWKPEEVGDIRKGEVRAVRETKDFGDHQGRAIHLMGPAGMFSIPVSAALERVDWRQQIGKVFKFTFNGWKETKEINPETGKPNMVRTFIVQPLRYRPEPGPDNPEDVPF